MAQAQWTIQDAKNKFSAVVNAAQAGSPQLVTRRGVPAAVVVSVEEYQKYLGIKKKQLPDFGDYLLSIPQSEIDFERLDTELRDIDL